MKRLLVGTRASALARRQTAAVCAELRAAHGTLDFEIVMISTHGDDHPEQAVDTNWPAGAFTGALERALLEGRIDIAVHSHKDLQTATTPGLSIAAVPPRAAVHDVLVANRPLSLAALPAGLRVATGSPRRRAQIQQLGSFELLPLRGNVPTRIERLERDEFDATILAAAGLIRLGIDPLHAIPLPIDRFVPAAAQGALAVQTRTDDPAQQVAAAIDHGPSRDLCRAERSVLAAAAAGCHTAIGALASITPAGIRVDAQLFSEDGRRGVQLHDIGSDPIATGQALGQRLRHAFEDAP